MEISLKVVDENKEPFLGLGDWKAPVGAGLLESETQGHLLAALCLPELFLALIILC